MSKTIEECGGYAFPCTITKSWKEYVMIDDPSAAAYGEQVEHTKRKDVAYSGMTLRDWFAGQSAGIMMAALSNDKDFNANPNQEQFIAERAYELADALLEVRGEITD